MSFIRTKPSKKKLRIKLEKYKILYSLSTIIQRMNNIKKLTRLNIIFNKKIFEFFRNMDWSAFPNVLEKEQEFIFPKRTSFKFLFFFLLEFGSILWMSLDIYQSNTMQRCPRKMKIKETILYGLALQCHICEFHYLLLINFVLSFFLNIFI